MGAEPAVRTRWARFLRGRPLMGGTLSVAAITAIARLNGGVREILVARDFGTSNQLEAFLVGFGLVTVIVVALGGAMSAAFVPTYYRLSGRLGQEHRATALVGGLLPSLVLVLGGLSLAVAVASPGLAALTGGGFDAPTESELRSVIVLLAPVIIIGGLSAFFVSVVNAQEHFTIGALPQLLNPIVTIVVLLSADEPRATTLAVAFLAGAAAECLASLAAAGLTGLRPHLARGDVAAKDRRLFFAMLFPISIALAVQASSTVIDQAVASYLPQGQVAILAFGSRITGFVGAVGLTAVGTVVLPQFSRLVVSGESRQLRASIRAKSRAVVLAACAVALPLAVFSEQVLQALFGRGEFTPADVEAAARVQSVAVWQLPVMLIAVIHLRLLSAQHRQRTILWISLAGAALNLGLDVMVAPVWGTPGIAGATVVAMAFMAFAYRAAGLRGIPRHDAEVPVVDHPEAER